MDYLRFAAALIFVLALVGLLGWILRRFGPGSVGLRKISGPRRLDVLEIRPLDAKRRLILVRRDSQEYLLLVGGQTDLIVDSTTAAAKSGE